MSRTALITGASRGIGAAIAQTLLDADYTVIGIARDFSQCPIQHEHFTTVSLDLSALDTLPEKLSELVQRHPDIDTLILNAGYGRFGSLEEFSAGQIRALIDTNLTSPLLVARALLPAIKRKGGGDIVVMGSESALAGGARGSVYAAAKFGLRGMTQSLRKECAAAGIRVCLVNPGMVRSEFFNDLDFKPGPDADNAIEVQDVADAVAAVLALREGTVVDEINLSPQKKVIKPT